MKLLSYRSSGLESERNWTAITTHRQLTITTSTNRGPCTPLIRVISISAVAEGPEINVVGSAAVAAFHASAAAPPAPSASGDAVAALMGLGVSEPMARRVVEQAVLRLGEDAAESVLIKAALQELGR